MTMQKITAIVLGAGNRGMHAYAELSKREDVPFKIVAAADPDKEKTEAMRKEHNIQKDRVFRSWKEALSIPKICEAAFIATPDHEHAECAIAALNKGYHVLLEKPMAQKAEDCRRIIEAQEKSDKVMLVAHVLRYTKFFRKVKEIIGSRELGRPVNINMAEDISYWHFAHSYVRGDWRRNDQSGPIVLTKCCHDLDIFCWLIGQEPESVHSMGALNFFTANNEPRGAADTCLGGCKAKAGCVFDAEKIYCTKENIEWPANVVSPVKLTIKDVRKALLTSQYGRCVFRCDNDVFDTQSVTIRFKGDVLATLQINGHSADLTRKIYINLTEGHIEGDLNANRLVITRKTGDRKSGDKKEVISFDIGVGDHAGGDYFLMKAFADAILTRRPDENSTTAKNSLTSHLIAFAADESAQTGKQIKI
jgi:predicted dehydrogenase